MASPGMADDRSDLFAEQKGGRVHRMCAVMPENVVDPRALAAGPTYVLATIHAASDSDLAGSYLTPAHSIRHAPHRTPKSLGMAGHAHEPGRLGRRAYLPCVGERHGQRNLAEHMLAGGERRQRLARVFGVRRGDDDRIHVGGHRRLTSVAGPPGDTVAPREILRRILIGRHDHPNLAAKRGEDLGGFGRNRTIAKHADADRGAHGRAVRKLEAGPAETSSLRVSTPQSPSIATTPWEGTASTKWQAAASPPPSCRKAGCASWQTSGRSIF